MDITLEVGDSHLDIKSMSVIFYIRNFTRQMESRTHCKITPKGDFTNYDNWRIIPLLCVTRNIKSRFLLNRVSVCIERILKKASKLQKRKIMPVSNLFFTTDTRTMQRIELQCT